MGCDGCELWSAAVRTCYAGVLHERFGGASPGYAPTFGRLDPLPRSHGGSRRRGATCSGTGRPDKPWLWSLPRLIFVSDMSDALSEAVPFEYLEQEVVGVAAGGGRLAPLLAVADEAAPAHGRGSRPGWRAGASPGRPTCGRAPASPPGGPSAASTTCSGWATATRCASSRSSRRSRRSTWPRAAEPRLGHPGRRVGRPTPARSTWPGPAG